MAITIRVGGRYDEQNVIARLSDVDSAVLLSKSLISLHFLNSAAPLLNTLTKATRLLLLNNVPSTLLNHRAVVAVMADAAADATEVEADEVLDEVAVIHRLLDAELVSIGMSPLPNGQQCLLPIGRPIWTR